MNTWLHHKWFAALLITVEFLALLALCLAIVNRQQAQAQVPIKIGLVAPFTGPDAFSGKATQRGMILAINEINARGGVLGRPLELTLRNVGDDPTTGQNAINGLLAEEVSAVVGGIFNSGMADYFDTLHDHKIPLLISWGAMPRTMRRADGPNYMFCFAVNDGEASHFIAHYTLNVLKARQPAIVAEDSPWGDNNVRRLEQEFAHLGLPDIRISQFAEGETNMLDLVSTLRDANVDAVLMIATVAEGAAIARSMSAIGWSVPTVGHWGISGGRFVELAGPPAAQGVYVVQTFSFFAPLSAHAEQLLKQYHKLFGTQRAEDIVNPMGLAHAYDAVHLLALAIEQAGATEGEAIRKALEELQQPYEGALKYYDQPFSPQDHVAFDFTDLLMAQWQGGRLAPAEHSRLASD